MTHLLKNSLQIYIDDSKINGALGSGCVSESAEIAQSIKSPERCTVFQVKVLAIQYAARIIGGARASKRNVIAKRLSRLLIQT